ncbi:MAG: dTDP-4-dehydrorhamnose reductase [Urechidicola sp.]|jgi:dTDP-4-dehydrorhamnose reductase
MLKILVTGKGGQLARCIENIAPNYPELNFVFKSFLELDITDLESVESVFTNSKPFDYCINCAAYTAVDKAETEIQEAYNVNVLGSKNLTEACLKHNVTLIHISTDFVFDGHASKPYTEQSITNPLGVYGETKLEGENVIAETLQNYFILRTSWLYSEFGNNFLKTMLRLSRERDEISVVVDQIGSPTYAKDLAGVVLQLIASRNTSYGIYNYSNEGIASWYDFANKIFKLSNSRIKLNKIETKDYPTPAARPKYSVLDTSKIEKLLKLEIPNWKASLAIAFLNLEYKD